MNNLPTGTKPLTGISNIGDFLNRKSNPAEVIAKEAVTTVKRPREVSADGKVLIVRYKNRKLYNKQTSSYINIGQILDMAIEGQDVVVLDAQTSANLTADTILGAMTDRLKGKVSIEDVMEIIEENREMLEDKSGETV